MNTVQIPVGLAKRILNSTKDISIVRELASALAGGSDEPEAAPRKRGAPAAKKAAKKAPKVKRDPVPVEQSAAAVLDKIQVGETVASEALRPLSGLSKQVYQYVMRHLIKQGKITSEGQRRAMKYTRVAA